MNQTPEIKTKDIFQYFVIQGLNIALTSALEGPFDRVQTLYQTQQANSQIPTDKKFKGIRNTFTRVYREQGLLSFWRGSLPNVLSVLSEQPLNIALDLSLKKLQKHIDPNVNFPKFLSASLASSLVYNISTWAVSYPLEFARIRLATDVGKTKAERQYHGIYDVISEAYRLDGIKGLYVGCGIAAVGAIVAGLVEFSGSVIFDEIKDAFFREKKLSIIAKYIKAVGLSILSELASYPFETVSRRIVVRSSRRDELYISNWDYAKKIYREEGLKGFYKGFSISMLMILVCKGITVSADME